MIRFGCCPVLDHLGDFDTKTAVLMNFEILPKNEYTIGAMGTKA